MLLNLYFISIVINKLPNSKKSRQVYIFMEQY